VSRFNTQALIGIIREVLLGASVPVLRDHVHKLVMGIEIPDDIRVGAGKPPRDRLLVFNDMIDARPRERSLSGDSHDKYFSITGS
jgi:hypothetical protein